ncbi:bifunctional diaminohydroxyphosphoribosylaminopyrimidine deaminase/5-amino-6-(5-phosphoribosylamino)uracil reductase RibD [Thiomicrorhabdus sp. ZW0627]|uniref:bifunctional diaminohydroxyphosphoribosylaminopyrimidine deaminase/5-amino-6-(5-phosphoribosylamino)uracil reductase RibD n=1 Tax=Thiomicrorhabdus sp. ZW0627 TaxID=3039774 RepID=UPI002436CB9C|nr:bifunctional diaminohydroxyphosphoribosylaminopyrimidine deaminase/5-amino-6-(5-phosphoribosylamino)uracil reductase RibD [Thiomicrorhabdus sp. ZW0627]MDG6773213.1 bifunctional diaminohydroxyphosphoribosylaminopyrimidine deaminase/5-amino-6-(5-phosphoribosylamino)uracil reductase RibD [Thiomicrorhabdus sp. ZW0627]
MTERFSEEDERFMQLAIDLAGKGIYSTKPNPAVGCILVKNGSIVGQGWHRKAGLPHAERVALAEAGDEAQGSTAYVTLEPCSHHGRTPPCADGLIEAGVARVVVAMRDPNPLVAGSGIERMQQAGIAVEVGLLSEQARELNPGFIQMMEKQRPFVRLKMASSLDGRTAMANGESQWITGPEARIEVHKLRARSGAIVTGIGTVLADDPSMNVRLPEAVLAEMNLDERSCQPLRVVLDPNLSMPLDAKMLSCPGRTVLMTSKETIERDLGQVEALIEAGYELVAVSSEEDRLDIGSVLDYLAQEEEIREVMVESGAIVAGAFIQSGTVDELHSFIAPVLMGHQAKPMFVLPGMESMEDKLSYRIESINRLGEDVHMILIPKTDQETNQA